MVLNRAFFFANNASGPLSHWQGAAKAGLAWEALARRRVMSFPRAVSLISLVSVAQEIPQTSIYFWAKVF